MTGLETATLIVGLVTMGLIILYTIVLLMVTLMLYRKISKTQAEVQEKLDMLSNIPSVGKMLFRAFTR
jgi:hypothetical protein